MKNLLIVLFMIFALNSYASIEHVEGEGSGITEVEIMKNRSCWEEVSKQGCGDPGENPHEFRTCLKDVFSSLTNDCRGMMTELYGMKN